MSQHIVWLSLTEEESAAVFALHELAQSWPESLWIFAAPGGLHVMLKQDGKRVMAGEGVDQRFVAATINIESDGGDW